MKNQIDSTPKKSKKTISSVLLITLITVFFGVTLAFATHSLLLPANTTFCLDIVPRYNLLFIAIVAIVLSAIVIYVFRFSRIIKGFFLGLAILAILLILVIFWCSTRQTVQDDGQGELTTTTQSIQEVGELEVSAEKLRDVVATNLANLAALEELRAQQGALGEGQTSIPAPTQNVTNNYYTTPNAESAGGLVVSCETNELLVYDDEWICTSFEDAIEEADLSLEAFGGGIFNTKPGNSIGSYTDSDGDEIQINETITQFLTNPDGSLTHISEDGTQTTIVFDATATQTITTLSASGSIISYTNEDGVTTSVDIGDLESTTSLSINSTLNQLTFLDEQGAATTIDLTPYLDNTDEQKLLLTGNTLSLINGTGIDSSIDLLPYLDNTDLLASISCTDGEFLSYDIATASWNCETIAGVDGTVTNVTTGDGLSGGPITTAGTISISAPTCTATQKLSWNGSSFQCLTDIDTDTDTNLTEAEVDAFANNNGYLTSFTEVDGDVTNELNTTLTLVGNELRLTDAGGTLIQDLGSIDTNTLYTNGSGLSLVGTTFSVNAPTCAGTDKLQWNGSSFICSPDIDTDTDTDTLYTAGSGMTLTGTVFSVDNAAITPDWTNITNIPADLADGDDDTTYIAGTGLTLTGTTFSATDPSVTNELITGANLTGTNLNIIEAGVTTTVNLASLADTLSGLACATGEVAKWSGTAWACAPDIDTDTDTNLTEAEVDAFANNNGYLTSFTEVDGDVTNELITGANLTGNNLNIVDAGGTTTVDLSTLADTLSGLACTNGEVAKYNGSAWDCAQDIDTDTDTLYTAGTGLTLTGTTFSVDNTRITPDWTNITNIPADLADGDDDTLYTNGSGLSLTGTTLAITAPTCTATQKLSWNGSSFQCLTDIDTDTDTNTTYAAGNGIALTGTTFSADAPTCTVTQKLSWNGTAFVCVADTDTDTVTTLTDNPNGTFTYTNESTTATTVDHKDFAFDATTVQYADGKIQCLTDRHILRWDSTNTQWECVSGDITYTEIAGVPPMSCTQTGHWYEDINTGFKYVCDGSEWKILESTNSCYLGGAFVDRTGALNGSNGIISSVTRNAAGEYTINFSQTLVVNDYTIQLTPHDTDAGQVNGSSAIIDIISKGTNSAEVHINYGDNGGAEDVEFDSEFEVLLFDLNCDPSTGGSSSSGTVTSVDTGDGLTGGPITATGTVDLDLSTSGNSANISSNSGLETSTDGLSLLRGCSDGQTLKWNATTEVWECGSDRATYNSITAANYSNNTNTPTDVPDMNFPIDANEDWYFEMNLQIDAENADDSIFLLTCPAGAIGDWAAMDYESANSDGNIDCNAQSTQISNGDAEEPFRIQGLVRNAGTAGTVQLQARESTAGSAAAFNVLEGSVLQAWKLSGADLAEIYYASDVIPQGTIVGLDSSMTAGVRPATQEKDVDMIGVVSTRPGQVIGDASGAQQGQPVPVALAGRVPVRVTTENGPIQQGDRITASSLEGVGMRATDTGYVIGTALSTYDQEEEGTIVVFVDNQWFPGVEKREQIIASNATVKVEGDEFAQLTNDVWTVAKELVVKSVTIFEDAVTFLGSVTFIDRVSYGDTDAGGFAVIKEGQKSVVVEFENEFSEIPIVTASVQDVFVAAIATNISEKGFTIMIEESAQQDMRISWTALYVVEPRTFESEQEQEEGRNTLNSDQGEQEEMTEIVTLDDDVTDKLSESDEDIEDTEGIAVSQNDDVDEVLDDASEFLEQDLVEKIDHK